MKSRFSTSIAAVIAVFALTAEFQLAGQDTENHHKHHHYKLLDLGTFGGPQSYVLEENSYTQQLNNHGLAAGSADTPMPDPYPNFCFNGDCFVSHAFLWQDNNLLDLGVLPNGASSVANWISSNGLIAGDSQNGQIDPLFSGFPEIHAVLWRNGNITDLGTLPDGGYESSATAVNSHGVVVGLATNTTPDPNSMVGTGYQTRAFRWDEVHGMQDLGTLGGTDAEALLENDHGEIVGVSYTNSTPSTSCNSLPLTTGTFLWKDGRMRSLGNLGGTCTYPTYLSDQGKVLGGSTLPGDTAQHPFLWPGKDGKMEDLGTLGGTIGASWGINQRGEIAGWASTAGDQTDHAFLWRNGKMMDLGTVAGDQNSYAFSINSKGQVIGLSFGTTDRGFLWENGGPMVDLNALISPSDLYLGSPAYINDRGEINGFGTLSNGDQHAFLMIPCDDDHPGLEGCDYSLMDASATSPAEPGVGVAGPRRLLPEGGRRMIKPPRSTRGFTGVAAPVSEANATPRVKPMTTTTLMSCPRSAHALTAIPSSLNFGSVPVGQSKELNVVLCNWLPVPVTELGFFVTNNAFEETNNCDGGLPPRGSCSVVVVFAPKSATTYQGSVYVDNIRPRRDRTTISLSGHGVT
jgi:probable HAF family extracellular repeat protein